MKPVLALAAFALAGGCAQSPLYDAQRAPVSTRDEIPRDNRGEPIMSAIRPAPLAAAQPPLSPPPPGR